jgi:hypothetical protein
MYLSLSVYPRSHVLFSHTNSMSDFMVTAENMIKAIEEATMAKAELCREKAKYLNLRQYTNTVQADCKALMEENAALQKENQELRSLLNMRK